MSNPEIRRNIHRNRYEHGWFSSHLPQPHSVREEAREGILYRLAPVPSRGPHTRGVATVVAAVQVPQVRFEPDLEAIIPRSDLAHASQATGEDYWGRGDPLVVGVLTEHPAEEGVFHPRAHYRLFSSLSGAPTTFADLVDDAYQQTNVVVFLRSAQTQDILRVVQWVEAFVTREFGPRVSRATPTRLRAQLSLGVDRWLAPIDPTVVHWQASSGSQIGFAGPASLLIRINELVVAGHLSRLVTSRGAVFLFTADRFGSVTAGLLPLVPLSLVLVMSCGLLGLCGIPVEVGRSTTAARVIGSGDASTIHLVHRSRELVRTGVTATTALIGRTRASTDTIIYLDAGMVMAGFGVLMFSQCSPTFSLGSMVALTLGACVLVTVPVLPALLAVVTPAFSLGPCGRLPLRLRSHRSPWRIAPHEHAHTRKGNRRTHPPPAPSGEEDPDAHATQIITTDPTLPYATSHRGCTPGGSTVSGVL